MHEGELILAVGVLLTAGLAASFLAGRLRVPGLVLFLAVGMLVGSDGLGWIAFDDYELARTIGVVALALILFEGGLSAGLAEVRPVLTPAISLAFFGTIATAGFIGVGAALLFGFDTKEAMLVGAILAGTDGAATFALLRGSTLRRRLARTLEAESGLNDPVAILLVITLIEGIQHPDFGTADAVVMFVRELGIGAATGILVGRLGRLAMSGVRLATPGLYPVASMATALLSFGAAASLHGSGFLAVYVAGLLVGDRRLPAKRTVLAFHEGIASVAQIALFVMLGLLVFPSDLGSVALSATALALLLAFIARPLAVVLTTPFMGFSWAERAVLGWAGLRGAVPVVLATFPVLDGVPHSIEFFNIAFFAVLVSTLLQGATFEPLARALGVTTDEPALPEPLAESGTIRRLGAEVVEFVVRPDDAVVGHRVRELGLPRDALINVIVRGGEAVPPRGSTVIHEGDHLHVLVRREVSDEVEDLIERWRAGPLRRARRPRLPRAGSPVFVMRPWSAGDGDPAAPEAVLGVPVAEHLRTRRDRHGALLVLADGRYAVSGPFVAVGGARALEQLARRRLAASSDHSEQGWWQEVMGAVAMEAGPGTAG